MLATPGALPTGPEWVYEVKWDGMRLLAEVADGTLYLHSRSGREVTANFPELAGLVDVAPDLLLDGEVVLLEEGRPSFAALADRMHSPIGRARSLARPVTYMVFDILRLYGVPLLERPLHERRATVERLDLSCVPAVQLSPLYTDGRALFDATGRRGMEGILAKRRDSPYRAGRRSPSWVKVTHRLTQTCLVGGWRPEKAGNGSRIGALLLGVPDGGDLVYAGRVGSGIAAGAAQRLLRELIEELEVDTPPFADKPPRLDAAGARWCEPVVTVEVAHTGWTAGGRLRQPVFRGVRTDVDPADVHRGS